MSARPVPFQCAVFDSAVLTWLPAASLPSGQQSFSQTTLLTTPAADGVRAGL